MHTVIHTFFKKETREQTVYTCLAQFPLKHAWAHVLWGFIWNDAVMGLKKKSALGSDADPALSLCTSSRQLLPLKPKRLRETHETIQRGAKVLPLLSHHQLTIPSCRNHGNTITMVTHHSNPIAMLKSSNKCQNTISVSYSSNKGAGAASGKVESCCIVATSGSRATAAEMKTRRI